MGWCTIVKKKGGLVASVSGLVFLGIAVPLTAADTILIEPNSEGAINSQQIVIVEEPALRHYSHRYYRRRNYRDRHGDAEREIVIRDNSKMGRRKKCEPR